jgi:AbrB family looped-hinge helix DNA binding protein
MTTLQIRGKGTITLPASLRKKYNLEEGEVFTIIDLGGGSFLLKPRIYEVDKISAKAERVLREDGVTMEELFETLREVRKELFQERHGNVKKSPNDQG